MWQEPSPVDTEPVPSQPTQTEEPPATAGAALPATATVTDDPTVLEELPPGFWNDLETTRPEPEGAEAGPPGAEKGSVPVEPMDLPEGWPPEEGDLLVLVREVFPGRILAVEATPEEPFEDGEQEGPEENPE